MGNAVRRAVDCSDLASDGALPAAAGPAPAPGGWLAALLGGVLLGWLGLLAAG
jgi:hypothetical protein